MYTCCCLWLCSCFGPKDEVSGTFAFACRYTLMCCCSALLDQLQGLMSAHLAGRYDLAFSLRAWVDGVHAILQVMHVCAKCSG